MKNALSLCSTLGHDGDGVVRFVIRAMSEDFAGSTMAWGNEDEPEKLATLLSGFPKTIGDCVKYRFGSVRSGTCELEFCTLDGSGHIGVWLQIVAPCNSRGSDRFQSSTVFFRVEPSAIDRFCASLHRFIRDEQNEAVLLGVEEW